MRHSLIRTTPLFLLAIGSISLLTLGTSPGGSSPDEMAEVTPETPLYRLLQELGANRPLHAVEERDTVLAWKGRHLVTHGWTIKPNGEKTSRQSKHFKCTHCHNLSKEKPLVADHPARARLEWSKQNGTPFLPATTLYGVVNRESWYNGDYTKKYGRMAEKARDTLRNAIQLCATECSQGRALTDWEMEAVIQYLWTLELKLKDLPLSDSGMARLKKALKKDKVEDTKTLYWLRSLYPQKAEASFLDPVKKEKRNGDKGNPENGELIYKKGCMHCHKPGGPSRFTLTNSALDHKYLKNRFQKDGPGSVFYTVRKGTRPLKGYRPYMPHYTKEKMNRQQVRDLAAYIEERAQKTWP